MLPFRNPVNFFLPFRRIFFAAFRLSPLPCRESGICLKGTQLSIKFIHFFQIIAAPQPLIAYLSARGKAFSALTRLLPVYIFNAVPITSAVYKALCSLQGPVWTGRVKNPAAAFAPAQPSRHQPSACTQAGLFLFRPCRFWGLHPSWPSASGPARRDYCSTTSTEPARRVFSSTPFQRLRSSTLTLCSRAIFHRLSLACTR